MYNSASCLAEGHAALALVCSSLQLKETLFIPWPILAAAAKQISDCKGLSPECYFSKAEKNGTMFLRNIFYNLSFLEGSKEFSRGQSTSTHFPIKLSFLSNLPIAVNRASLWYY